MSIQNRNQTWGGALAPRSVPELSLLGLGQLLWVRWPHFAPRSVPPLPSSPQVSPPRAPRSAPRAFPLGRVCIPPQVPGHALWGAAAGPPWGDISGARYAQTLTHSSWAWGLSSNAGLAYLPPPTPVLLTVSLPSTLWVCLELHWAEVLKAGELHACTLKAATPGHLLWKASLVCARLVGACFLCGPQASGGHSESTHGARTNSP